MTVKLDLALELPEKVRFIVDCGSGWCADCGQMVWELTDIFEEPEIVPTFRYHRADRFTQLLPCGHWVGNPFVAAARANEV